MRGPLSANECIIQTVSSQQQRCINDDYIKSTVVGPHDEAAPHSTTYYQSQQKKEDNNNNNVVPQDDATPIWKVGRILVDSLNKGKAKKTKIFGTSLDDLPLNNQGLPKIAHRLCLFIEHYGLMDDHLFTTCKKQSKQLERYKVSFDRTGDADLENSPNAKIAAALLKIWLRELPQPLISPFITGKLMAVYKRYNTKDVYDIQTEVSSVLCHHLPTLNLSVLYVVVQLLNRYTMVVKCYSTNAGDVSQIAEIFTPILTREHTSEHAEIIAMMINNFRDIFDDKIIDKVFKYHSKSDRKCHQQKITKDSILSSTDSSGLKNPATDLDDKLVLRDEKQSPRKDTTDVTLTSKANGKSEQIKCVSSSQENFNKHSKYHQRHSMKLIDEYDGETKKITNDENEFHSSSFNKMEKNGATQNVVIDKHEMSEVQIAIPPISMIDDGEQEKIRHSERFSPQYGVNKKNRSYKRRKYSQTSRQLENFTNALASSINSIKMNINCKNLTTDEELDVPSKVEYENEDVSPVSSPSSSSSSPSTSTSSSTISSPLKSPVSPERIYHVRSNSEPLTSLHNWSLAHYQPDNASPYKDRANSPRNSISRRSFSEFTTSSSRSSHSSLIELQILNVSKQVHWLKKKMKRFEEDYYDKHGQFPSFCQKMAAPEYKQMSASLILLKNNLKQLKKESIEHVLKKSHFGKENILESIRITSTVKEDVTKQVEKILYERRRKDNRPERVEDMSFEQLEDEKLIIQKMIHDIEHSFGEVESRAETLFQPIYNHQRTIRRLLARSATSLKFKESSSDLATIKENETMEFGNSSSDNVASTSAAEQTGSLPLCQEYCAIMSSIQDDTEHLRNIHSLPSNELWAEFKITKDRKRKLKHQLQMVEIEATTRSANDLQHCVTSLRHQYKRIKAKLKLLDALLVKMK